jgi:indole-3-glycerol phosphate synthase
MSETILDRIVEQTKSDVAKRKQARSIGSFADEALYHERAHHSLKEALRSAAKPVHVIAEVKKASPSQGIIRADFNALTHALDYEDHGASAISCLTDEPFFKGELAFLKAIAERVQIPILRKDFIIDPFQIEEAKAHGANAILLIASICSRQQLIELNHAATEIGLECLVELYSEHEKEKIDESLMPIIGVNNRDLNSFEVNVHRGVAILNSLENDTVKVSESGLRTSSDLALLHQNGIHAALIGEHFMRQPKPGVALQTMLNGLEELISQDS